MSPPRVFVALFVLPCVALVALLAADANRGKVRAAGLIVAGLAIAGIVCVGVWP